jgi:hypothetical protein
MILPIPVDTKKDCISTIFEITSLKYFFRCGRIRPSGSYRGGVRTEHKNTAINDGESNFYLQNK